MKKILFLLLTAVCAMLYAPPAQAWTAYLQMTSTPTETPKIWAWHGSSGNDVGVNDWANRPSMTALGDNKYSFTGTGSPTNIKFTIGSTESKELIFIDGETYSWNGTSGNGGLPEREESVTIYIKDSSGKSDDIYLYVYGGSNYNPEELNKFYSSEMTDKEKAQIRQYQKVETDIYKITFSLTYSPGNAHIMVTDGNNIWKSDEPTLYNGHQYTLSSAKKLNDDGEFVPSVTATSVELWKDGVKFASDNAAPYSFSLSDLTGDEKFLVKVNYDDNSLKSYTVSSGTNLTETSSTTGFSIDSKIINTVMTVNVSGTAATSYSLNGTVYNAVTGVYLGSTKMDGSGSKYTLSGVTNNTTGYTVKVTTTRDTEGATYTVTSGSNLLAGTHTLAAGSTNFTVASTLATFNAEVAMNTTTFVPSSITIGGDTPDTPGTKKHVVYFRNRDYNCGGQNGWSSSFPLTAWNPPYFYITENGSPLATKTAMVKVEGESNVWKAEWTQSDDNAKAKLLFYNGTFVSSDYDIYGTQTVDIEAKEGNYIYEIKYINGGDKWGKLSGEWVGYTPPVVRPEPGPDPETIPAGTYMPLRERDFFNADGSKRPHYFIVGSRTADWSLQPEWELEVSGNSATLSGRFMYQGYFGIAMVDNYHDYVYHRYTLYYNSNNKDIHDGQKSLTLNAHIDGSGAVRYGKGEYDFDFKHGKATSLRWQATARFKWDNGKWTEVSSLTGADMTGETLTQSKPSYINLATLTLDSEGIPTRIAFDYDYSEATIAANKSMTLVGNNIRYVGDFNFGGGVKKNLDKMGRIWEYENTNTHIYGWSNSWIQSDSKGKPYVDARGRTLYLTAYDKNWLTSHSTNFYNDQKKLPYNSASVTFLPPSAYDEYEKDEYQWLYRAHPEVSTKIGDKTNTIVLDGGEVRYKEVFPSGSGDDDYGTATSALDNSGWQCMVVKNMWLQGKFKVWSGSGAGIKDFDAVNSSQPNIQWFFENGGHGKDHQERKVVGYDLTTANGKEVTLYPTKRDIDSADFTTVKDSGSEEAQMKFYSRVVLWYNPTTGFENSVLQFIEPVCAPVIQAFYQEDNPNKLRYKWWINIPDAETNSSYDNYKVTTYTVFRINPDGSEKAVEHGNADTTVGNLKYEANALTFNDPDALSEGYYRYRVEANVESTVKKQLSNRIPIFEAKVPVELTVKQVKYAKNADGSLSPDDEGEIYSFDLEMKAEPKASLLNDKVGDKTVRDLMKYYVITVDESEATRLNAADGEHITFTKVNDGDEIYISDGTTLPTGTWYNRSEITDKNKPALTSVWKNVAPTAADNAGTPLKQWNEGKSALTDMEANPYPFTVYLVSENGAPIDSWKILQFQKAEKSTHVIAPATSLTVNNVTLAKVTRSVTHTHKNNMTHPSGARLNGFKADSEGNLTLDEDNPVIALPVKYQRFNETVAPATISALPVVGDVTKEGAFGVNYRLYLMPAVTAIDGNYANSKFNTDINGVNDNARNNVSLNLYDVDLSQVESNPDMLENAIDGGKGKRIKADTELQFDSHILVEYTKGGKTYVNPYGEASSEISFTANMAAPEVSTGKAMYRVYEDFYYHMSPKELEEANKDDDWPGKPAGKISVGHYAHAVVDMNYSVDSELESYAAFHVQQKALYDGSHKGVYGHTVDPKNDHASYIHKFAGTRSANGGQPLCYDATGNAGNDNVFINRHNDGGGTNYEIHSWGKDDNWTTDWADRHDWSTMAAKSRRLPIEINPAASYGATAPAAGSSKPANITGTFAAVYPVIKGSGLRYLINGAQAAAAKAEAENEAVDLYLFQAKADSDVDFRDAKEITTGVEDIMADQINGDTEFYNLQGIRVMNPAKGQIYIVRQGDKVSKVLYR